MDINYVAVIGHRDNWNVWVVDKETYSTLQQAIEEEDDNPEAIEVALDALSVIEELAIEVDRDTADYTAHEYADNHLITLMIYLSR